MVARMLKGSPQPWRLAAGRAAVLIAALISLPSLPAADSGTRSASRRRTSERLAERDTMATVIERYGVQDESVLSAMRAVPRHEFVSRSSASMAYADTPLPIGHGQTISQPYIVAEMTRLLRLTAQSRVLEIGTGSGYQAAVLAEITPNVFTVEIIKPLVDEAAERLKALGYDTVRVLHADGYYGWPEKAPFDGIIVTCAAGQIPPPLITQLAPGGRMVIPVAWPFAVQHLMLITKDQDGTVRSESLMAVRFVPLTRSGTAPAGP